MVRMPRVLAVLAALAVAATALVGCGSSLLSLDPAAQEEIVTVIDRPSVFITNFSFAIYVVARLIGPLLRDRRRRHDQGRPASPVGASKTNLAAR